MTVQLKSYDNVDKFIQEGSSGSNFITICGTSKFFFEAMECNKILTMHNWIVLSEGFWSKSYHKYNSNLYNNYVMLKRLQYRKIYHSDAVVIITDSRNYIEKGIENEIAFANHLDLPIIYYNGEDFRVDDSRNFISCKKQDIQITEDIINEFEARFQANRSHI